jgi:beta-galactosidase/beta-glucuronidase
VGAANYRSHVWVNQRRVCDHEGGYTPFDCEVTGVLHPGSNFVVIAVDATRLADGIPSTGIDWFNYGGLTRDVSLVTVPRAFIDDYDIHLVHGTSFDPKNTEITGYVHVVDAPSSTVSDGLKSNGKDGVEGAPSLALICLGSLTTVGGGLSWFVRRASSGMKRARPTARRTHRFFGKRNCI